MKKILLSIVALFSVVQTWAYTCKINGICYDLNNSSNTATVTYSGYPHNNDYTGAYGSSLKGLDIVIPSTISYNDVEYTVTAIGDNAFYDSGSSVLMASVSIPSTVTSIGKQAFWKCTALTSITIPSSVTTIGDQAFWECTGLTTLTIEEGVTTIGSGAFSGCYQIGSINIPSSVSSIGNYPFSDPATISVASGNTIYDSRDNCNAIIETATNTLVVGCQNTVIPTTVTSIGQYAFCGTYEHSSRLVSITLPSSITSIGNAAFSYCYRLESIVSKIKTPFTINGLNASQISSSCVLTVPEGTRDAYIAAGWTESIFKGGVVEAEIADIDISSNEICTYSSTHDLDFSGVSGLKAYIISGFSPSTGKLTLTQVDEVPAGEGLLLKGTEGSYEVPYTTTDMYYSNLLTGVTTTTEISPTDGDQTNFILADGVHGINFYTLSETGDLAAGKAYLHLPTSTLSALARLRGFTLVFDDETTGIDAVSDIEEGENACYDLQGRRVSNPSKGIYIINGKKVFIK